MRRTTQQALRGRAWARVLPLTTSSSSARRASTLGRFSPTVGSLSPAGPSFFVLTFGLRTGAARRGGLVGDAQGVRHARSGAVRRALGGHQPDPPRRRCRPPHGLVFISPRPSGPARQVALRGAHNPLLHPAYAEKTRFGARIVHGMLSASLFSGILGSQIPGTRAMLHYTSSCCCYHRLLRLTRMINLWVK